MYTQLDEGIASINMILGNRFVKVMRTECENFKKQVTTLNEALDLWTELQRTWMYLENIFSGGSIKQQMPEEAKIFENVNKQFLALTLKVQRSPAALRFIKSNPTIVENLTKMIEMLERVQDRLNIYIDTKK